ncbi:hypothetical protein AWC38_SpisGene20922 [Stylophora pistillata]|uniref:Uncharacterized protein n=1 Tax=Stylophora pistillata TaxID=50429 RepID=A0A2B4RET3_STYPI|nr:hypothetical protein AWC38_SpisGene20922 [Stylophora pistillata]
MYSFRRDRHVNEFIEACRGIVRMDFHSEALKQQNRKTPQCLQRDSLEKIQWTGQPEKRTEELATGNEHGNDNVVELKQSTRQRLKKRDSTRTPHFNDEIMLSENIDNMVEKEIPEIADESRAITRMITYTMNDEIPPEDLKQNNFKDSSLRTKCMSEDTSSKEEEDSSIKKPAPVESSAKPHPKLDPIKWTKTTEDDEKARKIKYLVSNKESRKKSKASNSPLPGWMKSDRKVLYWPTNTVEETDEQTLPLNKSVNMDQMDTIVERERAETFNKEYPENASIFSTDSRSHAKRRTLTEFHKVSNTKMDSTKQSTRASELTISFKKLAEDIEYILNDDVSPSESNNHKKCRKVSTNKKAKRPKNSLMRGNSHMIGQESKCFRPDFAVKNKKASGKCCSRDQKIPLPIRNLEDSILAKGLETSSILGPFPAPKRAVFSSTKENEQLNKDIEYILCDDIFAPGPHEAPFSESTADLTRPKTSNPKLSLAMEMDKLLGLESLAPTTSLSQEKINNFLDLQKPNEEDDSEIAEVIENILSDDIIDIKPERLTLLGSGDKNQIEHRVVVGETRSLTPDSIQRSKEKRSGRKTMNMTIPLKNSGETDSQASNVSSGPVSELPDYFSVRSGKILKTNFSPEIQITGTEYSTFGVKARPKTRNPRRSLADDINKSEGYAPDANLPRAFPNQKQDHTRKQRQGKCKLVEDGAVEETTHRPNRSCSYTALGAKKNHTIRKSDSTMDLKDFDSNVKTVVRSFTGSPSLQDSFKGDTIQKDITLAKQENSKCQKDTAIMCSPQSSSLARKTEQIALDESIKEILSISAIELHTSLQQGPVVSQKSARKKSSDRAEEIDLDEAIREILDIQPADLDAPVKNNFKNDKHVIKSYSPSQLTTAEDIDLDESIVEVFGAQSSELWSALSKRNGKPAVKPSYVINETESLESTTDDESLGRDVKDPTAHALAVPRDHEVRFLGARRSFSNKGTEDCDNIPSLANGDALRPVAAAESLVNPLQSTLSDETRQKLVFSQWETRTMSDLLVKEDTASLLTQGKQLQSVAIHGTTAVPAACGTSHKTKVEILYNSEELDLIKEIERQA